MRVTSQHGRLSRDGEHFVAVGADYHPSRAGCRIWTEWDPAEIREDFAAIAAVGLNTVRLFAFWRDFEPEPGRYEPAAFARLRQAVDLAGGEGLLCVVSLLTIWMNGQLLDLPWRGGRSLFTDEGMLARQEAFAAEVAASLGGAANLLAIDLGDEIANVCPGSAQLPPAVISSWQRRLAAVLRERLPGVLLLQANDASGVLGASSFGVDNAAAMDLVGVHGFPTWAPGCIESTMSYKATNLAAFLASFAGAYGVAFVDELGSYGVDEPTAAAYLDAAGAAALANGAAGVLAWCWRDIASTEPPYRQRPGERLVGLCQLDGAPKPALARLSGLARHAPRLSSTRVDPTRPGAPRPRAEIALYVPELARHSGQSYLDGEVGTLATFYSYLLLKRAHLDFDVVAAGAGAAGLAGYRLVICPSVTRVSLADLDSLHAVLAAGAMVYYSMGEHLHGFPGSELAGVRLVDFDLIGAGRNHLCWDNDSWPLDWPATAATATTVAATSARVLGRYPDGSPVLVHHQVGAGRVLFCAAPFESQLDTPGRLTGYPYESFYRRLAAVAGVAAAVDCPVADVELVPVRASVPARVVAVNHAAVAVRTELVWRDLAGATPLVLAAKGWDIVQWRPR